jgi:hypothetical protein
MHSSKRPTPCSLGFSPREFAFYLLPRVLLNYSSDENEITYLLSEAVFSNF